MEVPNESKENFSSRATQRLLECRHTNDMRAMLCDSKITTKAHLNAGLFKTLAN